MKSEFIQIVNQAINLFGWNRDAGVEYVDISEESIRIIREWRGKGSAGVVAQRGAASDNISNRGAVTAGVLPSVDGEIQSEEHTVICEGDLNAQIFFLSEALYYGSPQGQLFLNILKAMNLTRETVCLCTFNPIDYTKGLHMVRRQVDQIRSQAEESIHDARTRTGGRYPKVICLFGDAALKILMGREYMLTAERGKFHNYNGIHVMPTWHPAQILADSSLKRWVWEDMKQIMAITAGGGGSPNRDVSNGAG